MKFGPRPFVLSVCICVSSAMAAAQGAACAADGETPQTGAIACVTGDGVQVTPTSAPNPQPEVLPLTPEQRPASLPVVRYEDGKLTVVAKNSTLGDILRAIAAKTGASIDVPEGANERVVSQLGPAPARDVMAALLNGSHFNYVMVGTETNPDSVAHVILTAKSDRPEGGTATAALARPGIQPRTALQTAVMQPYQEMLQQQQSQQAAQELQQQVTETLTETPVQANSEPAAGSAAASSSASESAPVEPSSGVAPKSTDAVTERTPQQVLQNLYESRRQMMQQQHQAPAPPQQ
jgi:hypothetical protein